jgi:dTDP-4-dehydrorhamnose reductase
MGDLVAATTHHRNALPGQRSLPFDAGSTQVHALVASLQAKPVVAILLFGNTDIDKCARDASGTALINVAATIRVIEELQELGIKPVFASSDAVFDGTKSYSREEDPARPILTYGRQKLEVEEHLAALASPWLALRLPKLLSEDCHPHCMLTAWTKQLALESDLRCATDQYFTPAAVKDVADAITELIQGPANGLLHLGGPARLSRRELLAEVVDEYARHEPVRARITDCSIRDFKFVEARPLDTSLSSERATPLIRTRFRDARVVARIAVRACLLGRRGATPAQ